MELYHGIIISTIIIVMVCIGIYYVSKAKFCECTNCRNQSELNDFYEEEEDLDSAVVRTTTYDNGSTHVSVTGKEKSNMILNDEHKEVIENYENQKAEEAKLEEFAEYQEKLEAAKYKATPEQIAEIESKNKENAKIEYALSLAKILKEQEYIKRKEPVHVWIDETFEKKFAEEEEKKAKANEKEGKELICKELHSKN